MCSYHQIFTFISKPDLLPACTNPNTDHCQNLRSHMLPLIFMICMVNYRFFKLTLQVLLDKTGSVYCHNIYVNLL